MYSLFTRVTHIMTSPLTLWNSFSELSEVLSPRLSSVQFSSIAQLSPTLCDPTVCSTPGLPVQHQLPEFTQTHVHGVGHAIHHLILCRPLLLQIKLNSGTSLVVRWLSLCGPNAGGLGSIPGQGTRSHILQLRPSAAK